MKAFKAPKETLGDLTAETAANLVAAAADIALVIDGDGVIQDVAFGQTDLSLEMERYGSWFGRPWSEIVTAESKTKVDALLREAAIKPASGWRQIHHEAIPRRRYPHSVFRRSDPRPRSIRGARA